MANIEVIYAIATIFVGCILNNWFLELIVKNDSSAGSLLTLSQFLLIIVDGLVKHVERDATSGRLQLKARRIGLLCEPGLPWYRSYRTYGCLGLIFFAVSVLNNEVFRFHIAMPLHMIFRSCSLVTNIAAGALIFRKRYRPSQILSALFVSAGICVATVATASQVKNENEQENGDGDLSLAASNERWEWWLVGIALLVVTSVLSSVLGLVQEATYTRYGKASDEGKFYTHLITLPFFLARMPDMIATLGRWMTCADADQWMAPLGVLGIASSSFQVPVNVVYLIGNVATQYVCISGVFWLLSITDSLTTTLTLSVRKFVSLIISIIYFHNPFTASHCIGALLVAFGTFLYVYASPSSSATTTSSKVDEAKSKTD
jgi:solute carrier family 35 (UDP-xylose/UDP-N-acetylglucosamine transporter), member B4